MVHPCSVDLNTWNITRIIEFAFQLFSQSKSCLYIYYIISFCNWSTLKYKQGWQNPQKRWINKWTDKRTLANCTIKNHGNKTTTPSQNWCCFAFYNVPYSLRNQHAKFAIGRAIPTSLNSLQCYKLRTDWLSLLTIIYKLT